MIAEPCRAPQPSDDINLSRGYEAGGLSERRRSARVPLDRAVRIGPPGGLPYAAVSARDLSAGGLFVDAERSVRVGARFSVEVPLGEGDRVYVAEAEVVDNRSRGGARGFGARFVTLSEEARSMLEEEVVARAHITLRDSPADGEPSGFDAVDLPTLDTNIEPPPEPVVDDSRPPNPELDSVLPMGIGPHSLLNGETMQVRSRTRWSKMKSWVRSIPVVSGLLYGAAAVALMLVLVAVVFRGAEPVPVVVAALDSDPSRPAGLHERLVSGRGVAGLPPEPPPLDREVVNRLPEREPETAPAAAEASLPAASKAAVPAASKAAVPAASKAAAPAASKAAAPSPSRAEPQPAAAPKLRDAPRDRSSGRNLARGSASAELLALTVGPGARVTKQFVLGSPARLVVDLQGLSREPKLPAGSGAVRGIRFGRHDGFDRVVVDAEKPIRRAEATVRAGRLEISIRFD